MRILTEIPDDDVKELDALASKKKSSRAAAIRDAVKLYLVHNADNNDWIQRGAGSNIKGRCAKTAHLMKIFDLCPIRFLTPTS
jgi:metal-responsive CopG/Arc/MetJ family transcriptional regulator